MQTSELEPVHWSHLKRMSDSPAHYQASFEEERDSAALLFGRLLHYLLLGGNYDYAVWEGDRRQGKLWDAFAELHTGRDIFKTAEVDHALRIVQAVKSSPVAAPYLEGDREVPIDWAFLNRSCKSRIDVLNDYVVEVKTTKCSKPDTFRWDCDRYAYPAQCAFYQDAARYIRRPTKGAVIIAVEKELPYAVTVAKLSTDLLEEGRKLNFMWMERLLQCEAAKQWPAYVQTEVDFDVRKRATTALIIGGEEVYV